MEKWKYDETSEKRTPTGFKIFARYGEVSATEVILKRLSHFGLNERFNCVVNMYC